MVLSSLKRAPWGRWLLPPFQVRLWKCSGFKILTKVLSGFPGGSTVKNPSANAEAAGDVGLIPGSGRSPGEGNVNPLQYSCLENPTDRGSWRATVCEVQSETTEATWHTQMHTVLSGWSNTWGYSTGLLLQLSGWILSLEAPEITTSPAMKVKMLVTQSCPALCNPMGFPRQEYWSGLLFSSSRDLSNPGIEPGSPALLADSLLSEPPGKVLSSSSCHLITSHVSHPKGPALHSLF